MALQSRFIWVALSLLVLCSVCAQAAENKPPQVILTKSSGTAIIGEQITLDASGSRDPEGGALTFLWFFADDNIEKSGPSVTHAYSTPGTKTIGLTVTDNQGAQTVSSAKITVILPPSEKTTPPLVTETIPPANETFQNLTQMTPIANPIITMIPTTVLTNGASGQSPSGTGSGSNQGSAPANASPAGPPYIMYMVVVAIVL
ncbi:MAG: PKD domain-containing protein, partial [Methanoregula sp.]|nr:PKD domain-containing protein [Methanoregula sp.]